MRSGLTMNASAPASRARRRSSGPWPVVRTTIRAAGRLARSRGRASRPSSTGMLRSRRTMSGAAAGARSRASSPLPASPAISCPAFSSASRARWRYCGLSSHRKRRILQAFLMALVLGRGRRHGEPEAAAPAGRRFDADLPAAALDEPLADREPQPVAALPAGACRAAEGGEDGLPVGLGDPRTVVVDGDAPVAVLTL